MVEERIHARKGSRVVNELVGERLELREGGAAPRCREDIFTITAEPDLPLHASNTPSPQPPNMLPRVTGAH
jgi:hypothetical protein